MSSSTFGRNCIPVSFCLRAPGYGLTLWCALGRGAIQAPQLQLQLQLPTQQSHGLSHSATAELLVKSHWLLATSWCVLMSSTSMAADNCERIRLNVMHQTGVRCSYCSDVEYVRVCVCVWMKCRASQASVSNAFIAIRSSHRHAQTSAVFPGVAATRASWQTKTGYRQLPAAAVGLAALEAARLRTAANGRRASRNLSDIHGFKTYNLWPPGIGVA